MFTSHRYLLLASLVMGLAVAQAHAQSNRSRALPPGYPFRPPIPNGQPINFNPQIGPGLSLQQAAYNTAVLGGAYQNVPPYALGFNPYSGGPALASPFMSSPFSLSTTGGSNPFMGTGSLGSSPYSLSTGGGSSYSPSYGSQSYGYQDPLGAQLQGYASMINATGKYYKNIQEASLTREQVRKSSYETTKRRIELERWYEATRLKPEQLREREMAASLERARNNPPDTDISSGRALNTLLGSIQRSPQLSLGPNVPLDDDNLKHINLTSPGTAGNVGMLKDATKLSWPEALQDSGYDKERKRFSRNLVSAVATLKDGEPLPDSTLKDIRTDYKTINDKLNEAADELTPALYIDARRFLNQLNQAVRALGDKNVGNFFNKNWTPKGKNVAELVSHLSKEGLNFAPATPGDQAAYQALYLGMRQFEAGLATAQAQK
jgi:hypothetical protein